jgi:hypothetical protein
MIIFRSISGFDDLSSPDFVLPVLFPTAALLIDQAWKRLKTAVGVLAIGILAVGLFAAGRGISKEVYSNLETARRTLEDELAPKDTVLVSLKAKRLSAYFSNTFRLRSASSFNDLDEALMEVQSVDYAVFAAPREGRFGEGGYLSLRPPYRELCAKADSFETIERVKKDETVCVIRTRKTYE